MVLPLSTYLNGISACAVAIVAGYMGVSFLLKYHREHKNLMPYVSILGFSFVGLYLGPLVTFWSLVFTGQNIDTLLYGQLSYVTAPIAILNGMWLGFSIFNPEKRKIAMYVFSIAAIVFYIALFGFPGDMMVSDAPAEGQMLDISLKSVVLVLLLFDIISVVLILDRGFYKLSRQITGVDRKRAINLFWGFIFFAIAGSLETVIATDFVVIARIIMMLFIVFVYMGFSAKATPEPEAPASTKV